jgi:hypothetical protein
MQRVFAFKHVGSADMRSNSIIKVFLMLTRQRMLKDQIRNITMALGQYHNALMWVGKTGRGSNADRGRSRRTPMRVQFGPKGPQSVQNQALSAHHSYAPSCTIRRSKKATAGSKPTHIHELARILRRLARVTMNRDRTVGPT